MLDSNDLGLDLRDASKNKERVIDFPEQVVKKWTEVNPNGSVRL